MDLAKSLDFFQPSKDESPIHIVGCGSVGSTIAENIARSGVTNFVLWDFDVVEAHNLANQMFRRNHIGMPKVDALLEMLTEINPDIPEHTKVMPKGWQGEQLKGYVFLAVDSIELRRKIVERHIDSPYIKAMFDVRTALTGAQHYAADWHNYDAKKNFLASMNFSDEEAKAETPVSACNVSLSVAPTVRIISAYATANFMNFWNGKPLKNMIIADAFDFTTLAI